MSDLEFYRTAAGRQYYERTLPDLVEQLRRLADATERLVDKLDARDRNEGADAAT
jgi:hypothetical protein